METIRILGVDASLRNTGLAIVTYNTEKRLNDPTAFTVENCQVLVNPTKYTGTEAILNMIEMMGIESKKDCYNNSSNVIVESPPVMFNKTWSAGTISLIAHISGGAVAMFGIDKSYLFRPTEWNKTRKKEVTHKATTDFLGDADTWHYEKRVKSDKYMEHILDAASMALWWIKNNYLEE